MGTPKLHDWGFPVGHIRSFEDKDSSKVQAKQLLEKVREAYEDVVPDELGAALDEILGSDKRKKPEAFSLFLTRCLPMKAEERSRLLEMDSSIDRLNALLTMRDSMLVE